MVIQFKMINDSAPTPTVHDEDARILDLYAAEDVIVSPNETVEVSTGLAFIFPDDTGLMFMPIEGIRETSGLRYLRSVFVLQNNYYSQEEVKISFENTYEGKENLQKVHEYKLIDGTTVLDQDNVYDKGTVKICRGDCIARMMPVDAFYRNTDDHPKKPAKK